MLRSRLHAYNGSHTVTGLIGFYYVYSGSILYNYTISIWIYIYIYIYTHIIILYATMVSFLNKMITSI